MSYSGKDLDEIIARYAPISLGADLSHFTANEKVAIEKLVSAGRLIDRFILKRNKPL